MRTARFSIVSGGRELSVTENPLNRNPPAPMDRDPAVVGRQTSVKILSRPKLRLRAVIIVLKVSSHQRNSSHQRKRNRTRARRFPMIRHIAVLQVH